MGKEDKNKGENKKIHAKEEWRHQIMDNLSYQHLCNFNWFSSKFIILLSVKCNFSKIQNAPSTITRIKMKSQRRIYLL